MGNCCAEKKDIYLPMPATVQDLKMLNQTELYLKLAMDDARLEYVPGQFVEVSIAGIGEAPISISSTPTRGDSFELIVRKIGNVTNAIHNLKEGDKVGIRGPMGKGVYPAEQTKGKNLVFICGGIGLVPQRSFINYVLDNRDDYGNVTILLGTKNPLERICHSELEDWNKRQDVKFLETVDRGDESWKGNVGVVTTLMSKIENELKDAAVFICGPPVMYKFVLMSLMEYSVPNDRIYLNLERKMKCGVGKCGHCQINHYYACMNGPVFCQADLTDVPEAI
jgi:sulfhydrogenase subunit gamma (sulfur reductase)